MSTCRLPANSMKASRPSRKTCGKSVEATSCSHHCRSSTKSTERSIRMMMIESNQRAGHQADGARQVQVAVVHDPQDGGQQQQDRDEFER